MLAPEPIFGMVFAGGALGEMRGAVITLRVRSGPASRQRADARPATPHEPRPLKFQGRGWAGGGGGRTRDQAFEAGAGDHEAQRRGQGKKKSTEGSYGAMDGERATSSARTVLKRGGDGEGDALSEAAFTSAHDMKPL